MIRVISGTRALYLKHFKISLERAGCSATSSACHVFTTYFAHGNVATGVFCCFHHRGLAAKHGLKLWRP